MSRFAYRVTVPTSPLRFHGADRRKTSPSPKLGQHNSSASTLEKSTSAFLLELAYLAADVRLACAIGHRYLA